LSATHTATHTTTYTATHTATHTDVDESEGFVGSKYALAGQLLPYLDFYVSRLDMVCVAVCVAVRVALYGVVFCCCPILTFTCRA